MNYGLRPVSDAREQQIDTPVLEQLKTGVERAAQTGTRELTIHLKPEGLGDIVLHLTSTGDKTTVRIGVTNPETEKLVTSQMESLKDMLRPLNTEVQEVYHSSQNAMDFQDSASICRSAGDSSPIPDTVSMQQRTADQRRNF